MSQPWKGDPEQRKRAARFALVVVALIIAAMSVTAASRHLGW